MPLGFLMAMTTSQLTETCTIYIQSRDARQSGQLTSCKQRDMLRQCQGQSFGLDF